MERYYRFRNAERLLGRPACGDTPARSGELDDLTIYFASPQELNDPLEGHRETYFQGDLIVWRNLIRHYTLLLYASVVDVYAEGGDGLIKYPNLRPENYSGVSREVLEAAIAEVLSNREITLYLIALAGAQRRVSKKELVSHLHTLHSAIITLVMNELSHYFDLPDAARYNSVLQTFLNYIGQRSSEIRDEGGSPNIARYIEIGTKFKQQSLRANVGRDESLSSGLLTIFINFPEHFAEQIDYLVFPHWYVACFMKNCVNSSIWGSYGDNHKGICLIYKPDRERGGNALTFHGLPFEFVKIKNEHKPKDQWWINMPLSLPLMEVKYNSEFASVNFFTSLHNEEPEWVHSYWYSGEDGSLSACGAWMANVNEEVYFRHRELFLQTLTTKIAHWENETECRVVIEGLPWAPGERQVKYSLHQLEGLIFGISTPDDVKIKVIKKIAEHCKAQRRSDFKFYQAKFNDSHTEVDHELLEYVRFNADGSLNFDPKI